MEFPKKAISEIGGVVENIEQFGFDSAAKVDPADADALVQYAEYANARIMELQNQNSELMFKIRCVAQALK